MEYLNLPVSVLDSPDFVGADQVERGTWLCLSRYCIGQENGGLIEDCANWKDRQWQQVCRVTLREVRRKARLWEWSGNSLRVFYYPQESEDKVKAKRLIAQQNGMAGGRPLKNPARTQEEPNLVISEKAKGKEKEWNENVPPQPPLGESEGVGDLVVKIKQFRRRWGSSPALDARESRILRKNVEGWRAYSDEDWQTVGAFMADPLSQGTAYTQPRALSLALSMPTQLLADAQDWLSKRRRAAPALVVVPPPTGEIATADDVREIFQKLKA